MKIAIYDTHKFERPIFEQANQKYCFHLNFLETRLVAETVALAQGCEAVCSFVNDRLDSVVLTQLKKQGTQLIALRSAGYNHVDLKTAKELRLPVVRVPEYSPHAVAEHALCLILSLNRKIHRAVSRVRDGNFSLDGLVGFDLFGKTIGIVGTGKIGKVMAQMMGGLGLKVLLHDKIQDLLWAKQFNFHYVTLEQLYGEADIISLHVPLNKETRHLINQESLKKMKTGAMLINTGRGALIDTKALIASLKNGKLGYAGLDVYEEEEGLFFEDLSDQILQDDTLARLLTFPNVIVTSHQAFLTHEALTNIAETTLGNIAAFAEGIGLVNEIR